MAIGVALNETSIAIEEESTEGTYVAPTGASSFIEVLADGLEFTPAKELLERNNLTDTVERVASRTGTRSVSGTIPVEYKVASNTTAGATPETDPLYKSLLGGVRSSTSSTTKATGNTSTELQIEDADISEYAVGDIVLVREPGAFEVRPISAVDTTGGSASITFPFALANGAPSASVVVEAFRTYFADPTSSVTLSATRYIGGELEERNIGLRTTGASLDNFTTGQIPSVSFALEGLDFDRIDGSPAFTATFDTGVVPTVLSACIFIDGVQRDMNSFQWSVENELGFITSTCSDNGRISSRVTQLGVAGTMDPYTDDADADGLFTKFKANTDISIFGFALNPSSGSSINSTTGLPDAFEQIVAFWIPQAKINEQTVGDQEGIATNAISWQSHRENGNDSLFLGFI